MTRKKEIPDLRDKVLYVGKRHALGDTPSAVADRVGFAVRTLNEAIGGEPLKRHEGLTQKLRDKLADCLGVGRDWVEWFDPDGSGRDALPHFVERYDREGKQPPCMSQRERPAPPAANPPPICDGLHSMRKGQAWALEPQLCGVTLLGGQYEAADLDFELSGQPTRLTITDETRRRIILQRELVVSRCELELDLGQAEIHGGLTAMKKAVDAFLSSPEGSHIFVTIGGSASKPRLSIQVREGAIGLFRPLVRASDKDDELPNPLCWLAHVLPDTEIVARVRMYGADLQDGPIEETGLAAVPQSSDDPPAPIARSKGAELATDDRVRLMRRLWELAKAREQDPKGLEPGVITLAFDMRKYERKS